MTAGTYDIICEQNANFQMFFTWKNKETGVPYDLTSSTALMQVRSSKCNNAELIIEFSTTDNSIILGGVAGTFDITATATQTAALITGQYYYDLLLINGVNKSRIVQGLFTVTKGITQ